MSTKQRVKGPKRRGQTVKAQSDAGLAEVARATSRLWRKQPQNASVLNGGFRLAVVSTRITHPTAESRAATRTAKTSLLARARSMSC
jgi:hypothetical protein